LQDLMDNLDVPRNFKIIKKNKLPVIPVNRFRIEQVFMNLIGNAIKYHDKESGIIEIDYEKTNDFHQFSVADDGPGIALEFHEKVFMIFQTLQPRDTVESTGVGLSIVKKIIDEIGGKVWIESLPGKGAKFIFNIPANDG
jgi:signal transduction histidine kinase